MKRSKSYRQAADLLEEGRIYSPLEAANLAKQASPTKFDGTVEVVGPDGPVPILDLFQGRDELVVYQHMWYDGAPH